MNVFIERVIRFADLICDEAARLPVGHFEGDDLVVETPNWLAITCENSQPEGDRFWLYWLRSDGGVIEFSIKRSLEAAAAEPNAAVPGLEWHSCDVLVPATDKIWPSRLVPRSAIA